MDKYYDLYSNLSDSVEPTLEDEALLRKAKAEIHDDVLSRLIDMIFSVGAASKAVLKQEIIDYCVAKTKEEPAMV